MPIKVNLSAIKRNAKKINSYSPFYAVVKADAYGLGIKIASVIEPICKGFCVANKDEACELVALGIKKPVLILGKTKHKLSYDNIVYTVSDRTDIDVLRTQSLPNFAIKINTGMNRYGSSPTKFFDTLNYAKTFGNVHSVYSHLCAVEDQNVTKMQIDIFNATTSNCATKKHLLASKSVALDSKNYSYSRCGIALYGGIDGFESCARITVPVAEIHELRKGQLCGYGTRRLKENSRIAILPIGYADGYRRLTNPRRVYANGKYFPIISVCMDACFALVDETITKNDEIEILGKHVTLNELAKSFGTITYEVLTGLGKRQKRVYL